LKKWEDLKMHDDILTGILEYGFAKPSSIQAVAINQKMDLERLEHLLLELSIE
jgi:superfamily II DNA/RNA helicase